MPIIGLSVVIQLLCVVHCMRTGRNRAWLFAIMLMPFIGSLAYAIVEILPQFAGHREVRAAKAAAIRKLDPDREVRAARDALDLADTAANRIELADALVGLGSHKEAIEHYRVALDKVPGSDRGTQFKLAQAELEAGNPREARKILETLPESGSGSENDRARLFLARALEECGDSDGALAMYDDVGQRIAGGEAHCRRAALLLKLGRPVEAQGVLEDVERLTKRLDRFERNRQKDMYGWAARTLSDLRGPTT